MHLSGLGHDGTEPCFQLQTGSPSQQPPAAAPSVCAGTVPSLSQTQPRSGLTSTLRRGTILSPMYRLGEGTGPESHSSLWSESGMLPYFSKKATKAAHCYQGACLT